MDEEKRKKLVEQRKREQEEKELQVDLYRDLKVKDEKNQQELLRGQFENTYMEMMIIFLGTLIPLYILFFGFKYVAMFFIGPVLSMFEISTSGINLLIHILVWGASLYSVFQKRSILEDLLGLFY